VASLAGQAAEVLKGRTLVLTTTLRALRAIGAALEQQFIDRLDFEVLIQGNLPKRELLARFREGASQGRSACVLVASASFWEGIDIPGDELALVVIDKLPFPPPDDPLIEARSKRLEQGGKSSFIDYFVPEATVSLKQGAGRLIRRETDKGMLVVCDTRLTQMGYGRKILSALPPMRQIQSHDEFMSVLEELSND
jgi:ATP-dependent DNA helicase DinG